MCARETRCLLAVCNSGPHPVPQWRQTSYVLPKLLVTGHTLLYFHDLSLFYPLPVLPLLTPHLPSQPSAGGSPYMSCHVACWESGFCTVPRNNFDCRHYINKDCWLVGSSYASSPYNCKVMHPEKHKPVICSPSKHLYCSCKPSRGVPVCTDQEGVQGSHPLSLSSQHIFHPYCLPGTVVWGIHWWPGQNSNDCWFVLPS